MSDRVIASRPQRDGELRIALSDFKGRTYLNARTWYRAVVDDELRPGRGLSVPVTTLPWLRAAIERAEAQALADGLLDEEAYEGAGLELPAELGGARRKTA
jgi:hypothetical protein